MKRPEKLTIREVGPREGFQSHNLIVSTTDKIRIIQKLFDAGFSKLNLVSLVNPRVMPQVGDAEDLLAALGDSKGRTISALVPNMRGLDRAVGLSRRGLIQEVLFIDAMTKSILEANGIRSERDSWRSSLGEFAKVAKQEGLLTSVFISGAYGCSIEGPVPREAVMTEVAELISCGSVDEVTISDSTGQATPYDAFEMFEDFKRRFEPHPVTAHFHDSRGAALANVVGVLDVGIKNLTVDSAFGGLGGDVPFLPEAAGNLPTEDLVVMCKKAGIESGIDVTKVFEASQLAMEAYKQKRPFPSRALALEPAGTKG